MEGWRRGTREERRGRREVEGMESQREEGLGGGEDNGRNGKETRRGERRRVEGGVPSL